MSWDIRFPDPIPVPRGKPLVTLRDAGAYVSSLPQQTHDSLVWQTAIDCLLLAADKGGPMEFARLGMLQALYPKAEPAHHSIKKHPVWRTSYRLKKDR